MIIALIHHLCFASRKSPVLEVGDQVFISAHHEDKRYGSQSVGISSSLVTGGASSSKTTQKSFPSQSPIQGNVIIGNPDINWQTGKVSFSQCPQTVKGSFVGQVGNNDLENYYRQHFRYVHLRRTEIPTKADKHIQAMGSMATKLAAAHEAKEEQE